jgi:arylsulfatase A-like enzyme
MGLSVGKIFDGSVKIFFSIVLQMRLATLVAAVVTACLASSTSFAQGKPPNIVLIVADDAGFADLGSFGSEISTPNIDALASVGVRFTNFYVGPTCSPTRSMMLSGTDNHIAGLGNMAEFTASNQKGKPGYEGHLNDRVVAFPQLLKTAGYHTYMAGKWHMGEEPAHWPAARGFERDFSLIPGGGSHFMDMWGAKGEKQLYTLNGKKLESLRTGFHSTIDYTQSIIGNIEENRADGKPFFAYLAFQAPHDPFHLPDDWLDEYKGRYDHGYEKARAARIERMKQLGIVSKTANTFPKLPNVPAWEALSPEEKRQSARKMELFAAMMEQMDSKVGELVRYLKANNLYDNTLFIFFSDNGPEGNSFPIGAPWDNSQIENWGKKGTFVQYGAAWAQVGAGPFRMFKGFHSEGGIRAPLIFAGPGVSGSGRISEALAHVMDIPATILNAARVPYPAAFEGRPIAPIQGRSLASVLDSSRPFVRSKSDWLGWEIFGNRAIRQDNWKLLWLCKPAGPGEWQLFDLKSDPAELNDLSKAKPQIKARMIGLWNEYVKNNNVIPASESPLCSS